MAERILVVDDDPVQRRLLENMLQRFGYETETASGGEAALSALLGPDARPFDGVILDLMMPEVDGLAVLGRLREAGVSTPVIVQTAHGGIDNVVAAMRAGAADFVVKPVGAERLQVSVRNAVAASLLETEVRRLKRSQSGSLSFRDVITLSPRMQAALRSAEKAAASNITVLIEGESGVGKELVARAVHSASDRRQKPFVPVNCGAIPDNLLESTLFGHEKGAFTGATEKHAGKFVEASGGTLFLDEVGELPPSAQVKLLRALQEGEIDPIGARKPVRVDVRVISATNRNLLEDVQAGRFREDLFYRLHVFPIALPPLRERPEDIPELVRHFLARFAAEEGKRIRRITPEALAVLRSERWPGNVRQLENTIFRAVVLADTDQVGLDELPPAMTHRGTQARLPDAGPSLQPDAPGWSGELTDVAGLGQEGSAPGPLPALEPGAAALSLLDERGEVRSLEAIEAETIRFAIAHYRGHMSEVARRLRIGRSTLYRKFRELGLEPEDAVNTGE